MSLGLVPGCCPGLLTCGSIGGADVASEVTGIVYETNAVWTHFILRPSGYVYHSHTLPFSDGIA